MSERGRTQVVRLIGLLAVLALSAVNRYSFALSTLSGQDDNTPTSTSIPTDTPAKSEAEIKGDILMAQKKYQAAIKEYDRAPRTSASVWNKTGVAYHHLYNMTAAKSHYEKALRLNPKYAEAMNNLGTALYSEKKYGSAEKLYKKALKLSPRDATMYGNLGTLYFVQGNAKKGAEAFRMALSLDPNIFERSATGGIGEGISSQQRAVMNYSLAKTYANVGMNDRALQYLRMALSEGFKDRKKMMEEKEFAALRETPEFRQLVSEQR